MKRILLGVCILVLGLHASQGSKEQQENLEQVEAASINQDSEVKDLMKRVNMLGASEQLWPERKKMIARLIQKFEINPNDMWDQFQRDTPLLAAVKYNDIFFASFLLNHKADPNKIDTHLGEPYFFKARTKSMAQLLFGHGAMLTGEAKGKILHKLISEGYDPALIPLYVQHGANVNATNRSCLSPLEEALMRITPDQQDVSRGYVAELLKAGAKVEGEIPAGVHGWKTAPMILNRKIGLATANVGEPGYVNYINTLREIRAMMKQAYETGTCRAQRNAVEVHLIPDLANMCVESYEELEKLPPQNLAQ